MNFLEFSKLFPTEESIIDYIIHNVYHDEIKCPHCGKSHKIYREHNEKARMKVLHCGNCNYSLSIFKGTIFEKSDTDLRKWFYAINLALVSKKGISALQLKREIGVTYKTAWRMMKQIRTAMGNAENNQLFEALVEIDETYVGGKPRKDNHNDQDDDTPKTSNKRGRGTRKTPVVGVKERNSNRVYAQVALPNKEGKCLSGKQLFKILDKVCKDSTTVMTDDFRGYNFLDHKNSRNFVRISVNHSMGEFSKGNGIHTNGIESFWAVLKRGVYGIYHHISVKYMQKYIDEFCFRSNNRKDDAFETLVRQSMAF